MAQNLEYVTKLVSFLEDLSAVREVLSNPSKLNELARQSAAAIALTDKEKSVRAEHEQFMSEVSRLKDRIEKHDSDKTAFTKETQDQRDAFEREKSAYSKELNSKRLEISDRLEEISAEDKKTREKHFALRDELKKKEARLHEHAHVLDARERELSEREERLKKKLEDTAQ